MGETKQNSESNQFESATGMCSPVSCDETKLDPSNAPLNENSSESASTHELLLTPAQKRVLGYISAQTTLNGEARCSKKSLAKAVSCSEQTADRAVTLLCTKGLITVEKRWDASGAQLANAYKAVN